MIRYYLLLCFFGISAFFVVGIVAHEAILNGFLVDDASTPYQVSVQVRDHGHVCGGGIIGDRFVLTAAHCVLNQNRHLRNKHISVLAGTNTLNETGPPAVIRQVTNVFFPREFHPAIEFSHGDIAVLKLVKTLPLEHHERLRKLELPHRLHIDTDANIAGYGWYRYQRVGNRVVGGTDGQLRLALTQVFSIEDCERAYPPEAIQPEKHLCAKLRSLHLSLFGNRYGVCNGDTGGPLIHNDKTVIGILSRISSDCNERLEPALYTHVFHYVTMIINVMKHSRDPEMISLQT